MKMPPARFLRLSDAIGELVHDGDTVALEGFTHLIPVAAGHEIIRQGRRNLTLVRMTPDVVYDQLIGAGCARKLVFSWGGNPGVGSLHRLRDAVERGWPHPLEIEEHSHAGMASRYAATAAGLPFAVLRGYTGTDLGPRLADKPVTAVGGLVAPIADLPRPQALVRAADDRVRVAAATRVCLGRLGARNGGHGHPGHGECHARRGQCEKLHQTLLGRLNDCTACRRHHNASADTTPLTEVERPGWSGPGVVDT